MECDIEQYSVDEYMTISKDKSKWYGAVAIGYVTVSVQTNNAIVVGQEEI